MLVATGGGWCKSMGASLETVMSLKANGLGLSTASSAFLLSKRVVVDSHWAAVAGACFLMMQTQSKSLLWK